MSSELSACQAAAARDAGLGRLRRLTGLALGGAIVLSGAFAGIAARSSPGHKTITPPRHRPSSAADASAPALPAPQTPSAAGPAAPAAPPAAAASPVAPAVVSGGS